MTRPLASLLAALALAGCATTPRTPESPCAPVSARRGTRVLVFTRGQAPPYHASIPAGIAAIGFLGERHRFAVESTDDPTRFTDRGLRGYAAVVFLNTIGDVLDEEQQAAFQRYIRRGGGFVGIHAAAHTEFDWDWYGRLVGARFARLTGPWPAVVTRLDREHLSTRCLPDRWQITDEWYDFRSLPAPEVQILATLDERSYRYGQMGDPHPIAWAHRFEGGRAWYTGLGHTPQVYSDSLFLHHLGGGILWASGR